MGSPASLTLGPASPVEYLHALQEEKRKIEAFKRELPVCMHLIDQAIENARQRATDDQKRMSSTPVLENFMPLKRRWERLKAEEGEEEEEVEDHKEVVVVGRPAWMGEAHLWTHQHHVHQDGARSSSSSRLLLSSKHRQGGAFVPFNRDRQQLSSSPPPNSTPEAAAAPGLTTVTTGDNNFDTVESVDVNQVSSDRAQRMSVAGAAQPPRKARRCWSPELHRRFVNALQQLGGSQVATPKQIRELMKVDGLTNDEVKSHLQKYRLHTRRPSPSPASSPPPMVILGWVPPECTLSQPAAAPYVLQEQYKSAAAAQQQQPPKKHCPPDHQHLSPASQTSSLHGPSPGRHSSTDSYLDDEGTDSEVGQEQEMTIKRSTSSSSEEEHEETSDGSRATADHQRECIRGSSTTTTSKAVKLQTLRKVTRAAA